MENNVSLDFRIPICHSRRDDFRDSASRDSFADDGRHSSFIGNDE
jgi:hypothetical protein